MWLGDTVCNVDSVDIIDKKRLLNAKLFCESTESFFYTALSLRGTKRDVCAHPHIYGLRIVNLCF